MKPKKWEMYSQNNEHYIEQAGIPEETPTVATVYEKQDAVLIVLAPEMLAMLERLSKPKDGSTSRLTFTERKQVDDLIAKALGAK